ncbi:MAG: SDR family oxidoreductase [Acidobacteriia bacterium]|nr:SDR family oxidoreductase [Terriglobia bacterium]MBV8904266.1 SDR family oxidoreductase [Terriglobia bacterium]
MSHRNAPIEKQTLSSASRSGARILEQKCAVVFGAGGSIGAAVAKEFATEGARVFLAGRTKATLDAVAKQITAAGGEAQTAVVDALDDAAVNRYLDDVAKQASKIDILVDLTGPLASDYGNGKVAVELPVDEFMTSLTTIVKSHFITARAAARHMVNQKSGVIIFVTGSPARPHVPGATAIGAAFGAIENLTGNLAFEVSPMGVRVVCLRTVANVDSKPILDTMDFVASRLNITREQAIGQVALSNFLKVPATVQDTANAAVLIASDRARMMTGTVVNASAGAALD